ncbi:MAG TPA: hypothetical protein VGO55_14725 [Allosphingosinicella sp.]|nr:hypothetical protein [Allosphingosinicella sp.]
MPAPPRNPDHYAVLVGVSHYPKLGEPPPSDLKGPNNDVDAIHDWLVDPAGGGLDPGHVWCVKSPETPDPRGQPGRDAINVAFEELVDQAEHGRGGTGAQLGRRLYIFASGHGFSPTLNQGCLHAANATSGSTGTNVLFTAWLELFQEAGYFKETVLWMDCCMNRDSRDLPSAPTRTQKVSADPAGPSFVAFAARRPLRAVERPKPDGTINGVFTTILLEGLRGAAANPYGMVTGRSLADWLRNAQRGRVDGPDLDDPRVSKEPEILREDQDLIFARGLPASPYAVTLDFGGASGGKQARLWSSRPPRFETLDIPASGKVERSLAPGMYVVDLAESQLRQGFQVTAPLTLTVDRKGPPVVESHGQMASLDIAPGEPSAEIFVVDEAFNLVDRGVDKLTATLPFGIYKVRVRSGRRLSEEIYLLDSAPAAPAAAPELPPFSSPAPLPGSAATHEYHMAALHDAAGRLDLKNGTGGEILVMARQWRADDRAPNDFEPWAGIRLVNGRGATVADLSRDGKRDGGGDAWATMSVGVDPGVYFLRLKEESGREFEQSLVVSPGWRTDLHALLAPRSEEMRDHAWLRLAVLMHRLGGPAMTPADLMIDQARVALADERLVLGGELDDLLLVKFDNPIAGIIGGHLLLVEQARQPTGRIALLDEVVANLRGLVGDGHPDVEALSLRCTAARLRTRAPVAAPPMFQASWQILVEASGKRPELIAGALWKRVHALSPVPPFLAWSSDRLSKTRSREAIIASLAPAGIMAAGAAMLEMPMAAAGGAGAMRTAAAWVKAVGAGSARTQDSRTLHARLKALGLSASVLEVL